MLYISRYGIGVSILSILETNVQWIQDTDNDEYINGQSWICLWSRNGYIEYHVNIIIWYIIPIS